MLSFRAPPLALVTALACFLVSPVAWSQDDDASETGGSFDPIPLFETREEEPEDDPRWSVLGGTEGTLLTFQTFGTFAAGYRPRSLYSFDLLFSSGNQNENTYNFKKRTVQGQVYTLGMTFYPLALKQVWLDGLFVRFGPSVQRMFVDKCLANCKKQETQLEEDYLAQRKDAGWSVATWGLEIAPGYRYQWGKKKRWLVDFAPVVAYFPMKRISTRGERAPDDRDLEDDSISLRYLSWRAGVAF